ncbi:hypothetical protein HCN44_004915 [Aphidius gifuensis]|uniref:GRIP domain-containing protein n=1 Tax=Aphidius gifuensis TaxID=684658 RepID=A0A834XUS0_APHGI|nr:GRIP and coiled-coil domain-containing protein 2 isoform X2 [Aphidius gifuensis]KAF7992571.1 hypothetical protein HCN44_004915 [Aphidius gifuensis]
METETPENETPTPKDDIEERYNKLKGFAVKLKKKVGDLTEKLESSEIEKNKAINEKDEMQKKVLHISDTIKKLQTIQLEYDKLQDSIEIEKKEKKQLTKNLETLVIENTNLKESFYEEKENTSRLNQDIDIKTKEINDLKLIIKKNQILIKKLEEEKRADVLIKEQKEKDYDDIKNKLDIEIQLNKTKTAQLDAIKQEKSNNNVLSLEVDNYEKSIDALKIKLSDESSTCHKLELTIEEQRLTIKNLENQLNELRDTCFAKTNQLTNISDKNENLKSEICDLRQENQQIINEKNSLIQTIDEMKNNIDKLQKELSLNLSKYEKLNKQMDNKITINLQQIDILKCEIARLNDILQSRNDEIKTLNNEYEGYKLRAQSVLRNKKIQNKEININGHNIAEIETELNHLHSQNDQQNEKINNLNETIKLLTNELSYVKEERDNIKDNYHELGKKLTFLSQDNLALRDQCRGQLSKIETLQHDYEKKEELLINNNNKKLEEIEKKYQYEIEHLKNEIDKLSACNIIDNYQDIQTKNDMYLIEREDGEGSESIDSYTLGIDKFELNHKKLQQNLMPLDELLNSTDDIITQSIGQLLPAKVDRHELELCEKRVTHLNILLADAERDAEKLNQMNQLLKEDIRRQQRSAERQQHADNFEYLKNIIIKFVTLKNGDERSRLIPVLNTILKLSPEETNQLNQVAGVNGRGWLQSLPIRGWTND